MKIKTLLLITILLSIPALLVAENTNIFLGTWINPEYDYTKLHWYPKTIIYEDGTFGDYFYIEDKETHETGTYIIKDSWIDSEGNYWYKVVVNFDEKTTTWYHLWRIYNSGNTWEYRYDTRDFPTTMDEEYNHCIKYRQ